MNGVGFGPFICFNFYRVEMIDLKVEKQQTKIN
jgi:hypothetical protein